VLEKEKLREEKRLAQVPVASQPAAGTPSGVQFKDKSARPEVSLL